MTYKDIFRIAIRLLAVAAILYSLFNIIPQLTYYAESDAGYMIFGTLLVAVAIFAIYYFLIIKSDIIIETLKLTKGFDKEMVSLDSLTSRNLLEVGIIIIGCSTFIRAFPVLLMECFIWVSQRVREDDAGLFSFLEPRTDTYIAENFIEVLIGYLLITNFDRVVKFITPKKETMA